MADIVKAKVTGPVDRDPIAEVSAADGRHGVFEASLHPTSLQLIY
jgi:hypothetical protein